MRNIEHRHRKKNGETDLSVSPFYDMMSSISLDDMRKMYRMKEHEHLLEKYTFPTHPSSDGYYHIHVKDLTKKNKRTQIKAKTLEALALKIIDIETGRKRYSRSTTFADIFEVVQEERLKYVTNKEREASVLNTIRKSRGDYKRYFADTWFEIIPIEAITKNNIEDICFENLKKYSMREKAFASLRSILISVFKFAFEERWITENPYDRVNFKKFKDMISPSVESKDNMFSEDIVQDFLNYIRSYEQEHPTYWPAYALELQILMGLRRAEIPPLRWSDVKKEHIDICRELLTVYPPEGGKQILQIVNHTKTWKDRSFPITKDIQDFLSRLKEAHTEDKTDSIFLFPGTNGRDTVTNAQVYGFYRKVCKKLDIHIDPTKRQGPHSFRRNGITKVMNKTGNIVLASQLFGNSPEVAQKHYYGGVDIETARKALE